MATIQTIRGDIDLAMLQRTVIFEDRPEQYVISVRYVAQDGELVRAEAYPSPKTLPDEHGCIAVLVGNDHKPVPATSLDRVVSFTELPNEFVVATEFRVSDALVRRDVHVVLKEASVVASALAASIG